MIYEPLKVVAIRRGELSDRNRETLIVAGYAVVEVTDPKKDIILLGAPRIIYMKHSLFYILTGATIATVTIALISYVW